MGNDHSSAISIEGAKGKEELLKNFSVLESRASDANFGEGAKLQSKEDSSICFLREFSHTDAASFTSSFDACSQRIKLRHPHIVNMIGKRGRVD